jgi:glycosyltransferase involved in cell wall biosynthesis
LVAYRGHIGSSNVLIRAAAEGIPVVGSDWGLLGHYIRDRRLGRAVDTTDAGALAQALADGTTEKLDGTEFDGAEALVFSAEHSLDAFGEALYRGTA